MEVWTWLCERFQALKAWVCGTDGATAPHIEEQAFFAPLPDQAAPYLSSGDMLYALRREVAQKQQDQIGQIVHV